MGFVGGKPPLIQEWEMEKMKFRYLCKASPLPDIKYELNRYFY